MKRSLLQMMLFLFCATTFAQVHFRSFNLQQAMRNAAKEHKLILLQVRSLSCNECNSIADKSFSSSELETYLAQYCIPYVLEENAPDFAKIKSQYNVGDANNVLFLNADGDIVHRYNGSTSLYTKYITEIKTAVDRASTFSTSLKPATEEYNRDKKNFSKLYAYLSAREMAGLKNDSLVNELIALAPDDSLKSYSFIRFAIRQAPELKSAASNKLRSNADVFREAWYQMPLAERVALNNKINSNSMRHAIQEKNMDYARTIAASVASGYPSSKSRTRAYTGELMDYYEGVQDTASYLSSAVQYYDSYLAEFSPDSIKRQDSLTLQQMLKTTTEGLLQTPDAKVPVRTKRVAFSPSTQRYSSFINTGAYKIYQWAKTDFYRQKALGYARRALEFYESPPVLDTYARLLYVTGNKDEALNAMRKAIGLLGDQGFSALDYRKTMDKMKNNEPID